MGTIIVGQKKQQTVDMGGVTVAPIQNITSGKKQELSAEEKARIVKNIMALPKEQIVPALRKNGFNDIADITEAEMKADAEEMAKADAREKRLAEIKALPVEEQLPLLLEEGFAEDARKVSEELARNQQEHTDAGAGEESTGTEAPADGTTAELNDEGAGEATESAEAPADAAPAEEPEKKNGGHSKKTESK